MGNRAAVAFIDKDNPKPHTYVYLHWNGGPESVYPMVNALHGAGRMNHSASYTLAHFAALAVRFISTDGYSVGIDRFATPTEAANTADDNGAYIFHIGTLACERVKMVNYGTARKLTALEVSAEQRAAAKHSYSTEKGLPADLAAMLAVEEKEPA